ncbi:MAG: type II toxin-antitoxin system CcdA family antitoxin [Chloroflexota bacterium]|nr:type II toxin-antitoxin system CcdA family antitoxin [Chloroflexota bacterium]
MSTVQRVTLTLPADVLAQVRQLSQGNVSQLVAHILRDYVEHEQLQRLHNELVAGYQANAEEALEIATAFRYAEDEAVALHVPPYREHQVVESDPRTDSGRN